MFKNATRITVAIGVLGLVIGCDESGNFRGVEGARHAAVAERGVRTGDQGHAGCFLPGVGGEGLAAEPVPRRLVRPVRIHGAVLGQAAQRMCADLHAVVLQ